MKTANLSYRPDIDGLRALAVMAVMIYHIFPDCLPGGYVGVDVFFIISGYLISSIIFSSLENNTFSFWDFYKRRIKRIFPSLLVILGFTSLVGWIICLPSEYVDLGKMINATTTFSTNFIFAKGAGYFDRGAIYKPLLHIWSLSLEEQFYILFPIIVFLLFKIKRFLLPTLILVFLGSIIFNILFIENDQPKVFYLLHGRAWELLLGSLLAYGHLFSPQEKMLKIKSSLFSSLGQNILSGLGGGMILSACVLFTDKSPFPGWLALIPTLGSFFLILSQNSWINQKLLSHPFMVSIGLISYALYLWHWPLISFAHIYQNGEVNLPIQMTIFLGSFVLSSLTTRFIERPIRYFSTNRIPLLGVLMVLFFLLSEGISFRYINPLSSLLNPAVHKIDFALNDWDDLKQYLSPAEQNQKFPFYSLGEGQRTVFFFGDSNMEQYWHRVKRLMETNKSIRQEFKAVFAVSGSQIPLLGHPKNKNAELFLAKVEQYLKHTSIDTMVLGAQWVGYLTQDLEKASLFYAALKDQLIKFNSIYKHVYLILNIPTYNQQDPRALLKRQGLWRWELKPEKSYDSSLWLVSSAQMTKKLKALAQETNISVIDPYPTLCPYNRCLLLDADNFPVYKDSCHLTNHYVREHATFIDQIFLSVP